MEFSSELDDVCILGRNRDELKGKTSEVNDEREGPILVEKIGNMIIILRQTGI